jgi:hypothetical protein
LPVDKFDTPNAFKGPVALKLATPTRWNSTFYLLQALIQMQAPLLMFEEDCSFPNKAFVLTASLEFLTRSE